MGARYCSGICVDSPSQEALTREVLAGAKAAQGGAEGGEVQTHLQGTGEGLSFGRHKSTRVGGGGHAAWGPLQRREGARRLQVRENRIESAPQLLAALALLKRAARQGCEHGRAQQPEVYRFFSGAHQGVQPVDVGRVRQGVQEGLLQLDKGLACCPARTAVAGHPGTGQARARAEVSRADLLHGATTLQTANAVHGWGSGG